MRKVRWYAHMMSAMRDTNFRPNEQRLRGFGTGKGEGGGHKSPKMSRRHLYTAPKVVPGLKARRRRLFSPLQVGGRGEGGELSYE